MVLQCAMAWFPLLIQCFLDNLIVSIVVESGFFISP
jgi:hypothetical protein